MATLKIKDADGLDKYLLVTGAGTSGDPYVPIQDSNTTGGQKQIISQHLDTVGDGSGTVNAVGDYSVTPGVFKIAPGAGEVFRLTRLIGYIEDAGTFDSGAYGNNITLTNGISIDYDFSGGTVDLLGGETIKTNTEWASHCFDSRLDTYGAGNESLVFRWTFARSGQLIRLDGDANEELRLTFNDNLTGLVVHHFLVQGYVE